MFGTPFCAHEFTGEQLDNFEKVTCPCGNQYRSKDLREFNRLRMLITESTKQLNKTVQDMASFNSYSREIRAAADAAAVVVPVAPKPEKPKKVKPKRERPKLSVTQWLIVTAGFMVLVAASVFVSQNLEKWNVYGWSTLELSLGLIAGFGAFKLKRFSILLSNFLAVFSSAMLLTLIMSFSTTFGWGFTDWNREPAWFWAVNLGTVALVSLGLGMWSKNFGWRAIAPLSLSAAAITLVVNSAGTFEDRWRIAVLSIALFAVLIFVRLSRNAKWAIEDSKDKAYLKDLQEREDNSLKRFGVAVSILLAAFSVIDVVQQLGLEATKPLDGIATLTAAVVWLVGARINRSWVSAVVEKDETILTLRDTASAIGLAFLGLGVLSAIYPTQPVAGLAVSVFLLLLVFTLEHFAKALLLPTLAVTIGAWVTATFGAIWYLVPGEFNKLEPLGYYLLALGIVFAAREFFSFDQRRVFPIYVAGLVGTLVTFSHFRTNLDPNSSGFAAAFTLALIVVNLYPLMVSFIHARAKSEGFRGSKWIPLIQSAALVLTAFPAIVEADNKVYLLSLGSGFLATALGSMVVFKGKELADRISEQAYVAIGFSVFVALTSNGFEALKLQSGFLLLDGLLIFVYSLFAKNIRWAYLGYGLTSLSIVMTSYAWGTKTDSALFACLAIATGALVNLGLLWANRQFGDNGERTTWIVRATTALSLALTISMAERFVPLQPNEYWLLTLAPLVIGLIIEFRKANSFSFIYLGAALLAASPIYMGQSELDLSLRLALVLASVSFVLIRRSRSTEQPGWVVGAQISAVALGYFISRIEILQFKLNWNGPEVLSFTTAIVLAGAAWLSRSENVQYGRFLRLDLPVLVATVPSIFFAVVPTSGDTAQENATRLLLASGIIWAHNLWRSSQRKQIAWLVASYFSGLVLSLAGGWEIYLSTRLDWNGPEVYTLLIAAVFTVNALLNRMLLAGTATYLALDLPVLVATVPSILFALPNLGTEENITRLLLASAIVWAHNLIRSRQRAQSAWFVASYASGLAFAFAVGRELYQATNIDWKGPEVYSLVIALTFAANAWLGRKLAGTLKTFLALDLPVLIATSPSLAYGLLPNIASPEENANRVLLATGIIWIHNVWRTHQRKQQGWLIAQSITGVIFAFALVRDVYVNVELLWDGPELYSFAVLAMVLVGLKLASEQKLLQGSLYRFGLPIAVVITPSVFYSWTSVTKQFGELDAAEISRTLFVLAVAMAAMVIGILKANRGLNLVGTVELWLIGVPGLWFKTSSIDNGSADLELRGLIIAAVIYWAISLLRKYTELKLKSIVFIGIPATIALAPAIFHTLSTLGGTEIRNLDWWRFSIVLTVSLTLLVVGSLRELGGTFFPGLIGVIVTVLPYGFHPLSNKEWFLWAILLGVAGLLVWLAVRLENMRKAGREPSAWLKELK